MGPRPSVELACRILTDYYFPSVSRTSLLDTQKLRESHVVELGSGTGLLGIVLSPFVAHYTLTDIPSLLPLIRKNLERNVPMPSNQSGKPANGTRRNPPTVPTPPSYSIDSLDWLQLAATPAPPLSTTTRAMYLSHSSPISLILAVDCIYNTGPLLSAFLTTLDRLARSDKPGGTCPTALVVCELRDEDVIREFLEGWLSLPGWEVWSLEEGTLNGPVAVWVGVKSLVE